MFGNLVNRLQRGVSSKRSLVRAAALATVEGLEDRRLFSTGYALFGNSGTVLAKFDTSKPHTIVSTKTVDGLPAGTKLAGIDFRPATGELYALGIRATAGDDEGQIFKLDFKNTGDATAVGPVFSTPLAAGSNYGFEFNPSVDRIRIFNDADQNLRVNPNNGALVQLDSPLDNPSNDEEVTGGAYDRNVSFVPSAVFGEPAAVTTLFGIDFINDTLVRIGGVDGGAPEGSPNLGVVTEIGSLGITTSSASNGFDIGQDGTAFAILSDADTSLTSLYTIDLTTGAATPIEAINNGAEIVRGFAIAPDNAPPTAKPDTYTVASGTPLGVSAPGVLANDTDPEGNPLGAKILMSPSAASSFSFDSSGAISYISDPGFSGVDSFTYVAKDGTSDSLPVTVTINVVPAISVADAAIPETQAGQADLNFDVTLNAPAVTETVVKYKTQNGSAGEGDYVVIPSGSVTFAIGETSKQVTVKVKGDTKIESDETFSLKITSVTGAAAIADGTGVGTIQNDDFPPPVPTVFISDAEIFEGNSGTQQLVFDVTLNVASTKTITMKYATQNFTAGEGDYGVKSGTLTFTPGQMLKQISITIKGDTKIENNEQFRINLTNLVNVVAGDTQALGTIKDDDGMIIWI